MGQVFFRIMFGLGGICWLMIPAACLWDGGSDGDDDDDGQPADDDAIDDDAADDDAADDDTIDDDTIDDDTADDDTADDDTVDDDTIDDDDATPSWVPMDSGVVTPILDVWGSSPADVYAVGCMFAGGGCVLHYDGSRWAPANAPPAYYCSGVWGSSAEDVYVISAESAILHFDGMEWTSTPVPNVNLYGATGTSASDVYVVGNHQYFWSPVVYHYDGSIWEWILPSGQNRSDASFFNRGWCASPSDFWAVGGWVFSNDGLYGRYTGGAWSEGYLGHVNAWGIWGAGADNFYVVGGDQLYADRENLHGYVLHGNGAGWSDMTLNSENALYGVWGVSASDIYAVGAAGTIHHFDGAAWSLMNSGSTADLSSVWGSGPNDVFAVGGRGTILHLGAVAQ